MRVSRKVEVLVIVIFLALAVGIVAVMWEMRPVAGRWACDAEMSGCVEVQPVNQLIDAPAVSAAASCRHGECQV